VLHADIHVVGPGAGIDATLRMGQHMAAVRTVIIDRLILLQQFDAAVDPRTHEEAPPGVSDGAKRKASMLPRHCAIAALSLDAVLRHVVGDVRPDGLRHRDIGLAASDVPLPPFDDGAPIQRDGFSRVDVEGGVIVGKGVVERPLLEIGERAAIEKGGIARSYLQRLIAIGAGVQHIGISGFEF
jgi:hypothetical protein